MKILKGNFGECRFCDNMDKEYGLPSLHEKSWDLCLTDPPYNCNVFRKDKENYNDKIENYLLFCKTWFEAAFRCCESMLFTPGILNEWNYPPPNWELCWFYAGSTTHAKLGMFSHWQPILYYSSKVIQNCDGINLPDCQNHFNSVYPTIKPIRLWKWLLSIYKPLSVLDPFCGSGTTAQACEEMGLPWLCFELKEEYYETINIRINLGIKSHTNYIKSKKHQKTLI